MREPRSIFTAEGVVGVYGPPSRVELNEMAGGAVAVLSTARPNDYQNQVS
jgi:hypothetical protein